MEEERGMKIDIRNDENFEDSRRVKIEENDERKEDDYHLEVTI